MWIEYILSLMDFTVNNEENFQTNSVVQSINIGNKHHLNRPTAKLLSFQKRTKHGGIRMFNSSPRKLTSLKNELVQFKSALTRVLYTHAFYSPKEFLLVKKWLTTKLRAVQNDVCITFECEIHIILPIVYFVLVCNGWMNGS